MKVAKYPMTSEGAAQLRSELHQLKSVDRPKVIDAIAIAREHGDLKENAEYHAAREQQGFIEARIKDLEAKLSHAQIIDVCKLDNNGKVVFGVTVNLININTDQSVSYKIVGDEEADLKQGKISVNSPIARALIGKFEGDVANVQTPSGEVVYEVDSVEYL